MPCPSHSPWLDHTNQIIIINSQGTKE
jgi:hypothetical protein